jgi:endothelin-converting enzyme
MAGRDSDAIGERWRTCVSEIDGNLGWLLSAAFVERAFSAEAKSLGDRIIRDIKAVFSERLNTFEWMSNSTKQVAAKKGITLFNNLH